MFAGMLELPVSIGSLGLGPYLSAGIIVSLAAKSAKSFKIMIFEFWAEDGQDVPDQTLFFS
jgi:preprotein translocase subunit SecY